MTHLTRLVEIELRLSGGRVVRGWEVECACGWRSQLYASKSLASGAALAHRTAVAARES